jgi:uncharacterized membrane protein YeaQ/YmgE (transglycosylase-associated protein family)
MNVPQNLEPGGNLTMGNLDMRAILIFVGIGLLAGFLAFVILPGSGNIIGMLIAGILGSFVGGFVFSALKINLGNLNPILTQIITSTVGAIIVIIIARLI